MSGVSINKIPPLRGREQELAALLSAWCAVREGAVRFALVTGEPGAGKTRLIQALYQELSLRDDQPQPGFDEGYWPDILRAEGGQGIIAPALTMKAGKRPLMPYLWWALSCRQANESQRDSFQPFADGLEQLSGHLLSQLQSSLMRDTWGEVVHGMLYGSMDFLPVIGPVMKGMYNPLRALVNRLRNAHKGKVDEHMLERSRSASGTLEELLIQLIASLNNPKEKRLPEMPTVIVIDDMQWADARSISFTQRLLELAAESHWRLFVVATARSNELAVQMERAAGAGTGLATNAGELVYGLTRRVTSQAIVRVDSIGALPAEAMRLLVADRLPGARANVVDAICRRAEGQPYFAINYAQLISEHHWLDGSGNLIPGEAVLDQLPEDIGALIDRRLSLLEPDRRRVLNWGSVQGWRFLDTFIASAALRLGETQGQALLQLDGLDHAHGLVAPLPPPPVTERLYEFSHRLVFERVRQGFSPDLQEYRLVHAALAETLKEHLESGQLDEWPAEDKLGALMLLHGYAMECMATPNGRKQWAGCWLLVSAALLEVLHSRGDNCSAEPVAQLVWQELQPALTAGTPAWEPAAVLRALAAVAAVFDVRGRWEEWRTCAGAWLELSRRLEEPDAESTALLRLARLDNLQGKSDDGLKHYQELIALTQRRGDREGEAEATLGLGNLQVNLADYAPAHESLLKASALYEELGLRQGVLAAQEGLADAHSKRCELEQAGGLYEAILQEYRELGDQYAESRVLCKLGTFVLALENPRPEELAHSQGLFEQALAIQRTIGWESGAIETLRSLAVLLTRSKAFDRAIELNQQCLAAAKRISDYRAEARCLASLGALHIRQRHLPEALTFLEQARELFVQFGDWHSELKMLINIGMVHSYSMRDEQARECYQHAEDLYLAHGDRLNAEFAASCLGYALCCLGRYDESIAASQRVSNWQAEPIGYFNVSLAKWLRGDADALDHYRAGIERFGKTDDMDGLNHALARGLTTPEALAQLATALGIVLPGA